MKLSHFIKYFALSVAVIFSVGCSTEKNTVATRTYHNVTAHYNPYFNGLESQKKGIKKIENTPDNFSLLLPIFQHSSPEASASVTSEMDKAIKKASKVIKMHSITVKPKRTKGVKTDKQKLFYARKEFCNWVDDSYLMMGKAYFYKHEFFNASQTFEFIVKEYNNMPIKIDGLIWLSRTYIEQGNFKRAREILDQAQGEKEFPKRLRYDLSTTLADFYMKQKLYPEAESEIIDAIKYAKKKPQKARFNYILAQLSQQNGNAARASELYKQVIRLNPPYEMAFSAKINQATSFDAGAGDSREIRKQLNKMLKDDKNIEYQDQIYYALGNISYKEGKTEEAMKDFKLSAAKSISNEDQKALTYLALADIYFARPDYTNAQAYYDSAYTRLDKNFPGYSSIEAKTKNLTEIVTHSNTISREDSLQRIASMSEPERMKFIAQLIEKIKEEERRKLEEEQQRRVASMMFDQNNPKNSLNNSGGKWYFYNPTTVNLGKTQFSNKWGNRKLEDNWRRKNKSINDMSLTEDGGSAESDSTQKRISDNKKPEYYLQDLPLSDSLVTASNERIKEALYNLARAYKEKMQDYDKAIATYETLLTRFPDNEFLLASYYDLYLIFTIKKDQKNTDKYKNLIISGFPDSKYAKILTNPNYLKELEANSEKLQKLYEESYLLYKSKDFTTVVSNCSMADAEYPGNEIADKFLFLKALCLGENGDKEQMEVLLKKTIKDYPESDVVPAAKDMIAVLTKGRPQETLAVTKDSVAGATQDEEKIYSMNDKEQHLYIVVAKSKNIDINRLKFDISNYNFDKYSMIDFTVADQLLNDKIQLLSVKPLKDMAMGMNYFNSISTDSDVFSKIKGPDFDHFIISQKNFAVLLKDQDIQKYLRYFNKHYLAQ